MLVQIKPCNKSKTTNFIKVWLYLKKIYKCISLSLKRTQLSYSHLPLDVALLLQPPSAKCHMTNEFPPPQECIHHFTKPWCRWGLFFPFNTWRELDLHPRGAVSSECKQPMQTAPILPHLCWFCWLLTPLGVPWAQAGAPWLTGVPEEPAEGVLQGPVTGQGGRVAPGQVLRGGGSDVGQVPAAESGVNAGHSKHTQQPCSSQHREGRDAF